MDWSFDRRPTRARVDLAALAHNFALARRLAGRRVVIAVVKADAYGHGAGAVARRLVREGCGAFAVATVAELAALRAARIDAPVLVLGGVHGADEARAALALAATPVVHDATQLDWLVAAARARAARAPVHVEIDTGMRRLGVPPTEAVAVLARVWASPDLELEGVSTHFARADEADPAPTRAQAAAFAQLLAAARARGIDPGLVHLPNSAGLLRGSAWENEISGSAVRPGLMLYGVAPAADLTNAGLRPVMHFETAVAALRPVRAGDAVGYGGTWQAPRSGWVATLPMGYADGIPWSLGRPGAGAVVWLAGRRRSIVGRISMDLTTVWLEDDAVEVGAPALLFGGDGEARLPVEALAEAAGTIAYELLVRVGARVPRVETG